MTNTNPPISSDEALEAIEKEISYYRNEFHNWSWERILATDVTQSGSGITVKMLQLFRQALSRPAAQLPEVGEPVIIRVIKEDTGWKGTCTRMGEEYACVPDKPPSVEGWHVIGTVLHIAKDYGEVIPYFTKNPATLQREHAELSALNPHPVAMGEKDHDSEWFFRWIARGKAGYIGMTMEQCADMIWHSPANPYHDSNPWQDDNNPAPSSASVQVVEGLDEALKAVSDKGGEASFKMIDILVGGRSNHILKIVEAARLYAAQSSGKV